jgi:hypothetical protein
MGRERTPRSEDGRSAGAGDGPPRPVWEDAAPPSREPLDDEDPFRRWLLSGVVLVVAVLGVVIAALTDRRDAAFLFVGVPALLALAIAWSPRSRSLHGTVASGTAFTLLLVAILLQEGAICVLLSAPLVFAVTHTIAALTERLRGRDQAAFVLPLVLIASLEGVMPTWRVAPVQTVDVATVVEASADEVAARLAAGPDFTDARRPLLLRTGFPVPTEAAGAGFAVGDRWTFDYRGRPIVTEVSSVQPGQVGFALVHDGSKTARWLTWRDATLSWDGHTDGTTEVAVSVTFERGLDPSWWFGPVEDAFVRAGATYLLDALVDGETGP